MAARGAPKLPTSLQLHFRGRQGRQVDQPRALPSRVADLGPQLAAAGMHGGSPGAQLRRARFVLDHDVARALQVAPVDHDVAAELYRRPATCPGGVQALVRRRGMVVRVGQAFGHGRLAEAVGDVVAAGQGQGLFDHGHDSGKDSSLAGGISRCRPARTASSPPMPHRLLTARVSSAVLQPVVVQQSGFQRRRLAPGLVQGIAGGPEVGRGAANREAVGQRAVVGLRGQAANRRLECRQVAARCTR